MKRIIAICCILILAVGLLAACSPEKKFLDKKESISGAAGKKDEQNTDHQGDADDFQGVFSNATGEDVLYYADIVIDGYGTIVVQLDHNAAPITVDNFVKLAKSGFYDGLTFHRIIKDFMMQGGAGQAETIKGEFSENGWDNPIKHERGVISMARANNPNSGSSQFFIMHKTSPHLDGKYAAFGKVISGMDVVDKICNDAVPSDNNGSIPADRQPVITSITIREE